MENTTFTVGRNGDIYIEDESISKYHAEIQLRQLGIYLRDLDSSNGIFLIKNNRAIPFHEGYVQYNQKVMFGRRIYLISALLEQVDQFDCFSEPRMSAWKSPF